MTREAILERLLYVTLLLVFIATGMGLFIDFNLEQKLSSQQQLNQKLLQEVQVVGQENQSIAKQNRAYSHCIATIFAQYTHDFVPVTILNLDTCTLDSQTSATNRSTAGGTTPSGSASQAPAPPANPVQQTAPVPTPQPSPPPAPSLGQRVGDLLKKIGL